MRTALLSVAVLVLGACSSSEEVELMTEDPEHVNALFVTFAGDHWIPLNSSQVPLSWENADMLTFTATRDGDALLVEDDAGGSAFFHSPAEQTTECTTWPS
jgi:hypothetical protein